MKKNLGIIIGILALALIVLTVMGVFQSDSKKQVNHDLVQFAQCLKDEGAIFYGAFWCPHCQNQKKMFGLKASKSLPYVECSTPDGQGQESVCTEAGVESYPTWEFADGSRLGGGQSIQALAGKTGCEVTPLLEDFFKLPEDLTQNLPEGIEVEVLDGQALAQ